MMTIPAPTHTPADFAPVHPGEILLTEFLEPLNISQYRIAKAIDVPARRINEIVHGKRAITADTALRLSRALGLSDTFWITMQAHYDADIARDHLADKLDAIDNLVATSSTTFTTWSPTTSDAAAGDEAPERPAFSDAAQASIYQAAITDHLTGSAGQNSVG